MQQIQNEIQSTESSTRRTAQAVILIALGVALAPFTSIPLGVARVNPTQHFVNVVGAVLLGPVWATGVAFVIGLIRNALGVGTLLAFPGGMVGALTAGLTYRFTKHLYGAAAAEVFGSGIVGALLGAALVAPVFMDSPEPLLAFVPSFLGSSILGAVLGVAALKVLRRAGVIGGAR